MKCIHCGTNSKLKERTANSGRCTQCSHRFAFEPTTDARKVTDSLFQRCIKDVSGNGTLFFTEKQLWYEMNRRVLGKPAAVPAGYGVGATLCGAGGVVGLITGAGFLLPVGLLAGIALTVTGVVVRRKNPRPRRVIVLWEEFVSKYLGPYVLTHGPLEKLLRDVGASPKEPGVPTVSAMPPDLHSYSFDRALVTDHADTAAMLVANRFHFENNCAILSIDGRYPENGRFEMILQMLKQNPSLTVFGIHDSGVEGLRLPLSLRGDSWFPDPMVRIVDLGLRPLHVLKSSFLLTYGRPSILPPEIAAHLRPEEVTWLKQGDLAELASLRPARLMRAIYQGFNLASRMPTGQADADGGVVFVGSPGSGGEVWVDNRGGDVFAPDSFG